MKNMYIIFIASSILLFSIFYFGTLQTEFTNGFLPYGESSNFITGCSFTSHGRISQYNNNRYKGFASMKTKYWNMYANTKDFGYGAGSPSSNCKDYGNDFKLISRNPSIFITKQDMSNSDFKTTIELQGGTEHSGVHAPVSFSLFLVTGNAGLDDNKNLDVESPVELLSISTYVKEFYNVEIQSDPITNKAYIFLNGKKVKTIDKPKQYKIGFRFSKFQYGFGGSPTSGTGNILNPQFKSEFGCTINPNQQYYLKVFKNGDSVSLSKLPNFNKFCLSEAPLKVYTNTGSTSEQQVLEDLTNKMTYHVPNGQIWTIEYIGKRLSSQTSCEASKIYNPDKKNCISRASITYMLLSGVNMTISADPIKYIPTQNIVFEKLQNNSQFLLENINNNGNSDLKVNLFYPFISNPMTYDGDKSMNYKYDKNSWHFNYRYNGINTNINEGEEKTLNKYTTVKLKEVKGYYSENRGIIHTKQDYLFTIDTSFLTLKDVNNSIIVYNSFQPINGGLTIQTTDNVGTTKIISISKKLNTETTFNIPLNNIVKVSARPYIEIDTPQFNYKLQAKDVMSFNPTIIKPIINETIEQPTNTNGTQTTTVKHKSIIKTISLTITKFYNWILNLF